jgi:uncharacterized integral membrane protein
MTGLSVHLAHSFYYMLCIFVLLLLLLLLLLLTDTDDSNVRLPLNHFPPVLLPAHSFIIGPAGINTLLPMFESAPQACRHKPLSKPSVGMPCVV